MKLVSRLLLLASLSGCAPKAPPEPAEPRSALEVHQERAAVPGKDQTLEIVRLASVAMAHGDDALAEDALRRAVVRMQDFRADGQFRAIVGAERAKEWKGEPYEKMMAFLYLGVRLYQKGDYGNALAMSKSAILADTGTSAERFRSDFVPAFVLQALAHEALGERTQAERSMQLAVDALWMRALTDHMTGLLESTRVEGDGSDGVRAARLLLLAGLPPGLTAHPREPLRAIDGALSYATDLRRVALDGKKRDRPDALVGVKRGALRDAFEHLEPLVVGWKKGWQDLPDDVVGSLQADERFLMGLLDDPGLILWVESGQGPMKVADGEYGQILRLVPRKRGDMPRVTLDGRPLRPHYVDSVTYQAQTRGSRGVDGFLQGKAVFKDSSFVLGWAMLEAGNLARALDDESPLGAVLMVAGAATWVAGALTTPTADTRQWEMLPDTLWLVRADPAPGDHVLTVDKREYTVSIPDAGRVVAWLPRLPPRGPRAFGEPCVTCAVPAHASPREASERPLAIPEGAPR